MGWINLRVWLFLVLLLSGQSAFCQTPSVEITSYDIKAGLNLGGGELQVAAELGLNKIDTVTEFNLILNSSVKIGAIKSKTSNGSVNLPYKFAGKDTLNITIPPELVLSSKLTVDFYYTLPIGESEGNVIMLDRGSRWYPLILDQIVPFKLTVSVPKGYRAFSAGDLIEEKEMGKQSKFTWESKIPVFKLPIVIVESEFYRKNSLEIDGKNIILYSSSLDKEAQSQIIAEAGNAFNFYSRFIGEYPHNNLTLIEIPGMEGANIASGLLMIGTQPLAGIKQGYSDELLLSVACQWMAAGVFFKYQGKGFLFLQLSLPHYLRLRYVEKSKGILAFNNGLQGGLDAFRKIAGTEKEVAILDVDFPNTKEKATAIYGKGPYVIDLLRKQIGNEKWDKFIRDIYENFCGKILTYDEFVSYLSKYDQDGTAVAKLNKMLSEKGIPEGK